MATLPSNLLSIPLDANLYPASQPGLTWNIDQHTKQIAGQCDHLDAVRQAVEIILNTDRYRWGIYLPSSGMEYDNLIGMNIGYVAAELKRRITDALRMDDRVTGVSDYSYSFTRDELTARFTVNSIFGNIPEKVVVNV